jgi:hypothetical protein
VVKVSLVLTIVATPRNPTIPEVTTKPTVSVTEKRRRPRDLDLMWGVILSPLRLPLDLTFMTIYGTNYTFSLSLIKPKASPIDALISSRRCMVYPW